MLRLARRTFPTNPIVSLLSVLCRSFIYLFASILVKIAGRIRREKQAAREEKNFMRFYHLRSFSSLTLRQSEALWVIHAQMRFSERILVDFMTLLINRVQAWSAGSAPSIQIPGQFHLFGVIVSLIIAKSRQREIHKAPRVKQTVIT